MSDTLFFKNPDILVRTKEQNNDEFIKLEYAALRNEINQLKNGQITLLIGTISAIAIIFTFLLGLFINSDLKANASISYNGNLIFNLNQGCPNHLMGFIPLCIILPSIIIFFHKSVLINKKRAYCKIIENYFSGYKILSSYYGYENYCVRIYDKNCLNDKNATETTAIGKIEYIKKGASNFYQLLFLHQENRFWMMSFYSYLGLFIITLFVTFHYKLLNKVSFFLDYPILFNSILIAALILFLCLIGTVFVKTEKYYNYYYFICLIVIILTFSHTILNQKNGFYLNYSFTFIISLLGFMIVYICANLAYRAIYKQRFPDYFKTICNGFIVIITFFYFPMIIWADYQLIGLSIYLVAVISFSVYAWSFLKIWSLKDGYDSVNRYYQRWERVIKRINSEKLKELSEIQQMNQESEPEESTPEESIPEPLDDRD